MMRKMSDPTIFISAGEASGEHYGALLVSALQPAPRAQKGAKPSSSAWAAQRMAAAGLERIVRSEDMAVMGITEVVRHLPRIYREFRKPQARHPRAPALRSPCSSTFPTSTSGWPRSSTASAFR